MLVLVLLGFAVAGSAAIRSNWSPCGLSMLSSITPMGERGRGNTFRRTAAWYIVGAVAGGASLGAAAGLAAWGWAALGAPQSLSLAAAAGGAALAAAGDLGALGFDLPLLRRQVNERWLDQFRGGVYGVGFGWQIGVGVATYVMTTGVLLTVALGVLSGRPWLAMAECVVFGTVRGLTVLVGTRATSPEVLVHIHRRMDRLAAPVRAATIGVLAGSAVILAGLWWWPSLGLVVPSLAVVALRSGRRAGRGAGRRAGTTVAAVVSR